MLVDQRQAQLLYVDPPADRLHCRHPPPPFVPHLAGNRFLQEAMSRWRATRPPACHTPLMLLLIPAITAGAVVPLAGAGSAFWLCVPAALLAAARTRTRPVRPWARSACGSCRRPALVDHRPLPPVALALTIPLAQHCRPGRDAGRAGAPAGRSAPIGSDRSADRDRQPALPAGANRLRDSAARPDATRLRRGHDRSRRVQGAE